MANIAHIHQTLFNYAPNNASPYDSNGDRRQRLHAYLLGVLDAGHRRIATPECSIDTETTQHTVQNAIHLAIPVACNSNRPILNFDRIARAHFVASI